MFLSSFYPFHSNTVASGFCVTRNDTLPALNHDIRPKIKAQESVCLDIWQYMEGLKWPNWVFPSPFCSHGHSPLPNNAPHHRHQTQCLFIPQDWDSRPWKLTELFKQANHIPPSGITLLIPQSSSHSPSWLTVLLHAI